MEKIDNVISVMEHEKRMRQQKNGMQTENRSLKARLTREIAERKRWRSKAELSGTLLGVLKDKNIKVEFACSCFKDDCGCYYEFLSKQIKKCV